MPSTPLTCCSMGDATVSATVCALAPGYMAFTTTVGGVISGYCSMGSPSTATPPTIIVMIAMTLAKIGRSMKNRLNTRRQLPPAPAADVGALLEFLATSGASAATGASA